MQYFDLRGNTPGIRGAARRFAAANGASETHLMLVPDRPGTFTQHLRRLEAAYDAALGALGLDPGSAVFRRLFASDLANQREPLQTSALGRGTAAVSVVEQPPLPDAKLALYAYHVTDPGCPPRTGIAEDGAAVWEHHGRTHLAIAGLTRPGDDSSYGQMQATLLRFDRMLTDRGMTLRDHALRTWIYVAALDTDYQGIVRARRELFIDRGLTQDSHYLASTGIAGGAGDPAVRVMLDALAVKGLLPGQVHYLHALTHLSPTHLYGVTFERGVAVTYGDRTHALLSGTASIDAQGQIVHPGDVVRQLDRTLENMSALLADAGATLEDMTHVVVYLRDGADRSAVARALARQLPEVPSVILRAPVCRPGWLIELEGSAVTPAGNPAFQAF